MATDPRDKIYALLGLTSDGPQLVPMPNYKQTLQQVLRDLTRAIVVAEKSLDYICMKGLSSPKHENPSWAVNWLQFWSGQRTTLEAEMSSWKSPFRQVLGRQDANGNSLRTDGIILGSICEISSFASRGAQVAPARCCNPDTWKDTYKTDLSHNLDKHYPSGIAAGIVQSLILGGSAYSVDPYTIDSQSFLGKFWREEAREKVVGIEQWDQVRHWLHQNASLNIGELTLQGWSQLRSIKNSFKSISHRLDRSHKRYPSEDLVKRIVEVLQSYMRLMVTRTGLLGMAPPRAQVGDLVCYISGCSTPVILREKKMALEDTVQEHSVIGAAYVYVEEQFSENRRFADFAETYFEYLQGFKTIVLC